jgi:Uma2 family endonuclease
MYMLSASPYWTAEMVLALPEDGNRYEVIDGELLVSPAPSWTHQAAVGRLSARLLNYLDANRVGRVYAAPADISFSSDTLVQPDIFVLPRKGKPPKRWEDVQELLLTIEVLSPSSARVDRFRKRKLYLSQRVPEYWVVDIDQRIVERWLPGDSQPEILSEFFHWHPVPGGEPLVVDLSEFFAEVLGD